MRLALVGVMILVAFGRPSFAEQIPPVPENDPLFMRVIASTWPSEGAILVGNGGKHSAYELYVTNSGRAPLKIVELTVQGKKDDEVVMTKSAAGKELAAKFVPAPSDGTKPHDPILQPGQAGVFFIFANFVPGHADPDSFETAIRIEQHGARSGSGTIQVAELDINSAAPITIQSPLRGKNWSAANGRPTRRRIAAPSCR
jgi:hypothetical protein